MQEEEECASTARGKRARYSSSFNRSCSVVGDEEDHRAVVWKRSAGSFSTSADDTVSDLLVEMKGDMDVWKQFERRLSGLQQNASSLSREISDQALDISTATSPTTTARTPHRVIRIIRAQLRSTQGNIEKLKAMFHRRDPAAPHLGDVNDYVPSEQFGSSVQRSDETLQHVSPQLGVDNPSDYNYHHSAKRVRRNSPIRDVPSSCSSDDAECQNFTRRSLLSSAQRKKQSNRTSRWSRAFSFMSSWIRGRGAVSCEDADSESSKGTLSDTVSDNDANSEGTISLTEEEEEDKREEYCSSTTTEGVEESVVVDATQKSNENEEIQLNVDTPAEAVCSPVVFPDVLHSEEATITYLADLVTLMVSPDSGSNPAVTRFPVDDASKCFATVDLQPPSSAAMRDFVDQRSSSKNSAVDFHNPAQISSPPKSHHIPPIYGLCVGSSDTTSSSNVDDFLDASKAQSTTNVSEQQPTTSKCNITVVIDDEDDPAREAPASVKADTAE